MLTLKTQDTKSYTQPQQELWTSMFDDMTTNVWPGRACDEFFNALARLPITREKIPDLNKVQAALNDATGWKIIGVGDFAPAADLIECLVNKQFPVCVDMRPPEHAEFSPRPDIWHDLVGHSILLMDPGFAECMHAYGLQGKRAIRHGYLEQCDRVFFRTEVGILKTDAGFRLYGPAVITSKTEALNCLASDTKRLPFDVRQILEMPFTDASVQETYFYVEDFAQLLEEMRKDWVPLYRRMKTRLRQTA